MQLLMMNNAKGLFRFDDFKPLLVSLNFTKAQLSYILFGVFLFIIQFFQAQTCTGGGDQVTYGAGSWIGYVYDHNGAGNPVTNPFATYKGFVTQSDNFDRDWGSGNPSCTAGGDNFAVRYRMNKTFAGGTYTLTIGGDDGVRLSLDGGVTWILSNWSDHGYATTTGNFPLGGSYDMVIEYYEKGGVARVSYSSSLISSEIRMVNDMFKITVCGGTFYDSGGSGSNYSNNESRTVTFYPDSPGAKVRLDFTSFTTESSATCSDIDILRVYDGNSVSSPLVRESQTGCSTRALPGVVTSSACDGSLTVFWKTNGSTAATGWVASLSCVPLSVAGTVASTNVTNCSPPNGSITINPTNSDYFGGTDWYSNNFSSGTPQIGSSTSSGTATLDAGNLRLTNNVNSQNGLLVVSNPGFNTGHVEASFNMFMGSGTGADGLVINYGDLQIIFDSYRNGIESCLPENTSGGQTAISVSYLGTQINCYGTLSIRNTWQQVYLRVNSANQIYLKVGSVVVFNNVALGAPYSTANKSTWTWSFNAFTGASNDQHRIDDLRIIAYQLYEYSLDNIAWQNSNTFSNLNEGSYTVYMRARAPRTRCPLYTVTFGPIVISITSPTAPGDPSVFGSNVWNVYGYNGNSTTLASNNYYGFYTQPALGGGNEGIATQNFWSNGNSPTNAGTTLNNGNLWSGCTVPGDVHAFVHKRRGFPCGTYTFTFNNWDDETRLIINGTNVWSCGVWAGDVGNYFNSAGSTYSCGTNTFTYQLDANSEVEIRVFEGVGASNLGLDIIKMTPIALTPTGTTTRTCPTSGNVYVDFMDPNGRLLAQINPNTNNLGNVTVTSYVGTPGSVFDCDEPTNVLYRTAYMGRTWVVTSSAYPGTNFPSAVTIRLPFMTSELTAMNTIATTVTTGNPDDNGATNGNLMMTKYTGAIENNNPSDNCLSGTIRGITQTGNGTIASITNSNYVQFNVNQFSEMFLHKSLGGSPLPVELLSFSADCNSNEVQLNWSTASELNADRFIIERSREMNQWTAIGELQATGNSNQTIQYAFTDTDPISGTSYYRLRQVDLDGEEEIFGPISVDCENNSSTVKVYPNPTAHAFTVEIQSITDLKNTTVQLTNVMGKVISTKAIDLTEGTNLVYFQEIFESGTYLIRVLNATNEYETVKMVIKH